MIEEKDKNIEELCQKINRLKFYLGMFIQLQSDAANEGIAIFYGIQPQILQNYEDYLNIYNKYLNKLRAE